jgi:glycosyltransferase involved in cell wall biosynthesis
LRILYVVQEFSGPAGNWGSRSFEHPRRLVAMGHEVTLLCGSFYRSSSEDASLAKDAGIDLHQSPIRYTQRSTFLARVLSVRRYASWVVSYGKKLPRPDLVFASSGPLTMGVAGSKLARHFRVPLVLEVRDLYPEMYIGVGVLKNPLVKWQAYRMARIAYENATHIVALSSGIKEGIEKWGVSPECISVIPNCSDNSLFGGVEGRQELRAGFGWGDKLVCVYTGAMGLLNHLEYLLDCAAELDGQGVHDIQLAIFGDGKYKDSLERRISDDNLNSVTIHGPMPRREMPRLLAAADVGVVSLIPRPYIDTNSANKFFDYLAAGLPVVINYGGWQSEVLKQHGAGFSVDPHSPADLARVLVELRDSPEGRAGMGVAARKLAEERYDRDKLVAELDTVLRRVAGSAE